MYKVHVETIGGNVYDWELSDLQLVDICEMMAASFEHNDDCINDGEPIMDESIRFFTIELI